MMLRRRTGRSGAISLVPLVDVMMILLVFFMVTSTYRDLDLLSFGPGSAPSVGPGDADTPRLVRIGADGTAWLGGAPLTEAKPGGRYVVLPSPEAQLSALVSVIDLLRDGGAASVEIVRLEGAR